MIEAVDGVIKLRRAEDIPTLEELVAQITPENRYPETNWGTEQEGEKDKW